MSAYNYIDTAIAGLQYGTVHTNRISGGYVSKSTAGIEFGAPVFGYNGLEKDVYGFINDTGKIAFNADFVTSNVITITVNTVAAADVTFASSHAATMTAVIAAVNALTGVQAVLDSTDSNGRTILINTKGTTATVAEAITGGDSQATGTITYGSGQIFKGVAVFVQNSSGLYEQYDAVSVLEFGEIWVQPSATVTANQDAYVDNATTGIGTFTNSTAGVLVGARYSSDGTSSTKARVKVSGPTEMTYFNNFSY